MIRADEPLPTWWWAVTGAVFVVMVAVGLSRMHEGEAFVPALRPAFAALSLVAIALLGREWKRYRASR